MTVEQFEDAVRKGLGRAVFCLERNDPSLYADSIVAACVENVQHDPLFEEGRAPYLMELVERAGIQKRVLDSILVRLPDIEEEWSRRQIVRLLREYAKRGSEPAWQKLLEFAQDGDEYAQDRLAELGQRGLRWLVEHILPNLADEFLYRAPMWLDDAEEAGVTDAAVLDPLRERTEMLRERAAAKPAPKRKIESVRELLDRASSERLSLTSFALVAKVATHEELVEIAERLLAETDRHKSRQYALVFQTRPFPLPISKLVERARIEPFQDLFFDLLGSIESEEVRQYALSLLRERPIPHGALGALVASFRMQDTRVIAGVLPTMDSMPDDGIHSFVLDLLEIGKKIPPDDRPQFLRWIYEHSPCSFCRTSAVEDLAKLGAIPPAIREEAVWDAESDIRSIVKSTD